VRHLVVGTAGHIDHGKSALVEALTGVHPDRLAEERRRGITIELGFADLSLPPEGIVGFVDVPGHERFVRHMVAGATGFDAAMLVIAADDGVKPQTREHLAILSLLGLARGFVVLSKSDLVEADLLELVTLEARELVAGTFLEGAPVVAASAKSGAGLPEIRAVLRELLASTPPRAASGVPRLSIDRSFAMRGFGTVVTGTLGSGTLRVGDEVVCVMEFFSGRIRQPDRELLEMIDAAGAQVGQFFERHKAERLRLEAQEDLREIDRRKDQFLATLAHELRNPLAPLSYSLQLLRLAEKDPELRADALALGQRQLAVLVRLVDDLLDVSRVTGGKIQLRPEPAAIADVVARAVETTRSLVDELGHRLSIELPAEPVRVHGDPTRLAQVVSNLLNNAAKYSERESRIRLAVEVTRAGDASGEVVLRVADEGIGIPAEMLPRIFDAFVQADHSLERSRGGLGIGLTLVKRIVELHGGRVVALSAGPGRGSEFVVRLPLATSPTEAPAQAPAQVPARVARRRVLVVDDNRDSAETLTLLVRRMGHEVATAYDGLDAVERAASFQPEIVLLDIGLPRLNGYDAARRIRERVPRGAITLIAVTGWGQDQDRRRSKEAGFDFHVVKPVDPDDLETLLADVASDPDRC